MTFVFGIPLWILLAILLVWLYRRGTFKRVKA